MAVAWALQPLHVVALLRVADYELHELASRRRGRGPADVCKARMLLRRWAAGIDVLVAEELHMWLQDHVEEVRDSPSLAARVAVLDEVVIVS